MTWTAIDVRSQGDVTYISEPLSSVKVTSPVGDVQSFADARVILLANGTLIVRRDRTFSNAIPFERAFAEGYWAEYSSL